jgi:PAS domain S-box-containing protein
VRVIRPGGRSLRGFWTDRPMLESELFALLENTADAAYTVAADGTISSWNRAAERLFGHEAKAVTGRKIDEVLPSEDVLGTDALAGGTDAAARHWDPDNGGIPNFDLHVRTRDGKPLRVNVSTVVFDNARTGHRMFIRLVRDVTARRAKEQVLDRMQDIAREMLLLTVEATDQHSPTEALSDQERRVLRLFADGRSSAAIARQLKISPQTLRNHLHHINRKLRTHNRLEAVTHAQRRGLID